MGEAVLGKKAGNRAMLWGAIGGTIPDLDVVANLFTDEMTALAFHRAIMHSVFFAVVAPLLLGFLVHRLYSSGLYIKRIYKVGATVFWLGVLWSLFFIAGSSWKTIGISGLVFLGIALFFWRVYWLKPVRRIEPTNYWAWVGVFFWSIFTHPLLDSCTVYGTQLWQPFSDFRVALNNISIVDPLYTVPFLICLILAFRLRRDHPRRSFYNWLGIGISSLYMVFTFFNKAHVDGVFQHSWKEKGVVYQRHMTAPTIFNNFLWYGVAEGDTAYYAGWYSIFDEAPKVDSIHTLPKNHIVLKPFEASRDIGIVKWFSDGYYNALPQPDGSILVNDLRYGSFNGHFDSPDDYIFRFRVLPDGQVTQAMERNGETPDFKRFWQRVFGKSFYY